VSALCPEAKELAGAIAAAGGELSPELKQAWTSRLTLLAAERRKAVATDILILAIRCTREGKGPWEGLTELALAAQKHTLAAGQCYERGRDAASFDRLSGRVARPTEQAATGGTRLFDLLVSR
jgi:hypothetical protein